MMSKKMKVAVGVVAAGVAALVLYKLIKPSSGMDSPIIISDNSTHLHQKNASLNSSSGNYVVTVQQSGYGATSLECVQGLSCPSRSTPLSGSWQVTIYGTLTGVPIPAVVTTITPSGDSIIADYKNKVVTQQTDNDSEDMGGKDEVQADYTFSGFELRNGDGSDTGIISCGGRGGGGHCRLRIHYCHGGSC